MADYHSLLMRAVANLPNAGTPETRGAIYGRAKKALLEQLRSLRPPLPESDIAREEKALDKAIAEIEGKYGAEGAAGPAAPPTVAAAPASPPRQSPLPRRLNPPPSSARPRPQRPGRPPPQRDRLPRQGQDKANPRRARRYHPGLLSGLSRRPWGAARWPRRRRARRRRRRPRLR